VATTAAAPVPAPRPRLWFLDNLKVWLTFLVIAHHAGQAFGGTGGFWHYENPTRWAELGFFFWVNASFFMGLFFFISAYFLPGSYDRKGEAAFLKDKALRFGVPLLVFVLLVNPVLMYVSYINFRGGSLPFLQYWTQIYFGMGPKPVGFQGPSWPEVNFGHLWFVLHLLVYAVCYGVWRLMWRRPAPAAPARGEGAPGDLAILAYAVGLTLVSLVVRIWYPIDKWVGILGFIQAEPAHLPQYLSLFVLGILAVRRGWLQAMPKARGYRWLWIGSGAIAAGALVRFHVVPLPKAAAGPYMVAAECFIATGLVVGLGTLVRERWNATSPRLQMLAADAYGAYLLHVPILVAFQYGTAVLPLGPALKFFLVTLLGIPASFLASHWLRKVPRVERVV
jgi:glucans biosynthesis protein C